MSTEEFAVAGEDDDEDDGDQCSTSPSVQSITVRQSLVTRRLGFGFSSLFFRSAGAGAPAAWELSIGSAACDGAEKRFALRLLDFARHVVDTSGSGAVRSNTGRTSWSKFTTEYSPGMVRIARKIFPRFLADFERKVVETRCRAIGIGIAAGGGRGAAAAT